MPQIHPTAIIEEGAILGKNVSVGPYAYIGPKVRIGDGTSVASHAVIEGDTIIGKDNRIFSHTAIGTIPQDLKYAGEDVQLIVGDNNTIREFALINPGTKGGGSITKVGNNNLIMGYVHLGHDVVLGNHCILANATMLGGHVVLEDYAVTGAASVVHQFVHIGSYSMVGGASALVQDVPPFCLAEGNRAFLRGLNLNGLRRRMDRNEINALKNAYRALFRENRPLLETAQGLYSDQESSEHVKHLCQFVLKSKRGIPFKGDTNVH